MQRIITYQKRNLEAETYIEPISEWETSTIIDKLLEAQCAQPERGQLQKGTVIDRPSHFCEFYL